MRTIYDEHRQALLKDHGEGEKEMKYIIIIALLFIIGCGESATQKSYRLQDECQAKGENMQQIIKSTHLCWSYLAGSHSEELDEAIEECRTESVELFCPFNRNKK